MRLNYEDEVISPIVKPDLPRMHNKKRREEPNCWEWRLTHSQLLLRLSLSKQSNLVRAHSRPFSSDQTIVCKETNRFYPWTNWSFRLILAAISVDLVYFAAKQDGFSIFSVLPRLPARPKYQLSLFHCDFSYIENIYYVHPTSISNSLCSTQAILSIDTLRANVLKWI